MSQPSSANQTGGVEAPTQKQKTNIYTMMLFIAFVCIVIACVLLYMELQRWGSYPWWNTSEAEPRTAAWHSVTTDAVVPRYFG